MCSSATVAVVEHLIVWSINNHLVIAAFNHGSIGLDSSRSNVRFSADYSLAPATPNRVVELIIIGTVRFGVLCWCELSLVALHGSPSGQLGPLVSILVVFAHSMPILESVCRRAAAADEGDDESDDRHHDQQND